MTLNLLPSCLSLLSAEIIDMVPTSASFFTIKWVWLHVTWYHELLITPCKLLNVNADWVHVGSKGKSIVEYLFACVKIKYQYFKGERLSNHQPTCSDRSVKCIERQRRFERRFSVYRRQQSRWQAGVVAKSSKWESRLLSTCTSLL